MSFPTIRVNANTTLIGAATNVFDAQNVLISTNTVSVTVTIANTADPTDSGLHGDYPGGSVTVNLPPNTSVILRKKPKDTVQAGTGVYATKVGIGG